MLSSALLDLLLVGILAEGCPYSPKPSQLREGHGLVEPSLAQPSSFSYGGGVGSLLEGTSAMRKDAAVMDAMLAWGCLNSC